ncbi:aspartyl-phosphate phosphatase Spo0E family protein [Aquisalibacillus elongatus]|uniref:Stage 0 sporulation regulatory protein n=1 Tax=Aquisalibacillus elongatus TaxID=485577 RepID=A0A3N5B4N0_9BACI|nr:aspartyl-phosphate phosphatase Spo0E family protein [Aquisalibacillus elongatus]RPF52283.1 stage 0 sporulation regulatory protein [Aquisalibacillus elongatus]
MSKQFKLQKLQSEIEQLRSKMEEIASTYGYTSKESIQLSQELDYLLNEYQCISSCNKVPTR